MSIRTTGRKERRIAELDPIEQGVVITALNELRNEKLEEHRPTDAVDDVLLKVIDAPSRKVRVRDDEAR
ncbi:MAG: hypothetical protein LBQ48_01835 [Oscillospiraceae bacterium]|nr:hypothetical protein [Oscillospiraceae bacterium]